MLVSDRVAFLALNMSLSMESRCSNAALDGMADQHFVTQEGDASHALLINIDKKQ